MRLFKQLLYTISGLLFFIVLLQGCKPKQIVIATPKKIKRYSVSKVVKLVNDKTLNYETLSAKKVVVSYSNNGKSLSFRGSYKIRKDSIIQLYAQKLAIPVGKMEVNVDSFRIVDFMGQQIMEGKNNYLSNLLGMEIDYSVLQALLSNKLFTLNQVTHEKEFKDYVCEIEDDMYKITSIRDRKFKRFNKKEDKLERYKNRLDEGHVIKQDIYIDPDSFVVRRMLLNDLSTKRILKLEFSKFEKINNQWFPGSIGMNVTGDQNIDLDIELSKIAINENENFGFSISSKYKRKLIE